MLAKLSAKVSTALVVGCVGIVFALSPGFSGSAAASDGRRMTQVHKAHRTYQPHLTNRYYMANGAGASGQPYRFDPRNPEGYGVVPPPNAFIGPNYVFVPGVGILGESCDLPTSACPNEYRDIQ